MINRRNYYRILHVQPDAPTGVIKAHYRTLMQKLRLHPDLGGDDWNAALLNTAYSTLRDRTRRAEYDRELLAEYDIAVLSRGHLSTPPPSPPHEAGTGREGGNRRNFYRVLQVQPGAPEPLIDASYRVLVAAPDAPVDLLEEAYATLKDPRLRAAYDESLETGKTPPADSRPPKSTPYGSPPEVAARPASRLDATGYEPLITGYCAFCKTPHGRGSGLAEDVQCAECASPLSPPTLSGLQPTGRTLERMNGDDPLDYYVYWPGERMRGRLNDLSPSGMRFTAPHALGLGQVIKVDAPRLQATGEVAHARVQPTYTEVGLKFLTVQFTRAQGTFLSAKV